MPVLFETACSSLTDHVENIFKEGELDISASVEFFDGSEIREYLKVLHQNFSYIRI